jgi:hypothetical protein
MTHGRIRSRFKDNTKMDLKETWCKVLISFILLSGGLFYTVSARSQVCNVFYRLNTGIVDSNPIRGIDICLLSYVCVILFW